VTLLRIILSRDIITLATKVLAILSIDYYRNYISSIFREIVLVKGLNLLLKRLNKLYKVSLYELLLGKVYIIFDRLEVSIKLA
jgi:hypothetical protein